MSWAILIQLPLGVALMVLTTVPENQAPDRARRLLDRAKQEAAEQPKRQAIVEMISTIIVYKFMNLKRQTHNSNPSSCLRYLPPS